MRLRSTIASLALTGTLLASATAIAADDKARTYTRGELEEIVLDTIMQNPQVLIDAVQAMQMRAEEEKQEQARQAIQAYSSDLKNDSNSPVAGNPNGDVTVVEFFDYNCGYCKRSLPAISKLIEKDKNVKVVFKEMALLSPTSKEAAKASLAMYKIEPEKYFDFHAALFSMSGRYEKANLSVVVEGMGVDPDDFFEMMESKEVEDALQANYTLMKKLGSTGVPVFVIGSEMIPGAAPYEALLNAVNATRAAK